MTIRKIADLPEDDRCRHPSHDPPSMIVLPPGIYEHTCPGCGKTREIVVRKFGELGRMTAAPRDNPFSPMIRAVRELP